MKFVYSALFNLVRPAGLIFVYVPIFLYLRFNLLFVLSG